MSSKEGKNRVLVVDDSDATVEVLRRNLEAEGYAVVTASSVADAAAVLAAATVDLVITDIRMPGGSGLELVQHVRENVKGVEVIVITGYPEVSGAVAAMKNGATDYVAKPFTDEDLLSAVRHALNRVELREASRSPAVPQLERHGLLGDSVVMRGVRAQISKAARSQATVLVSGESGAGKELVARAIHYESERSAAPFVPVNCGAIPEELLESELFGHVKGAFTGAAESRAGFFLVGDGGTVFLDEVSETSQAMQVKLLRVLQEKEVRMVGAPQTRKVDVRVIAATNRDLEELVRKSGFREDLFFRLNVLQIRVPPLRERGPDIALLAHHFAAKFAAEERQPTPKFTDRVLEIWRAYGWPGNVRELANVVQRLVVMSDGDIIDVPDLPTAMRVSAPRGGTNLRRPLAEIEAAYIRKVLADVGGNKTQAAQILGIDRTTLREKLKRAEKSKGATTGE